MAAAEYILGLDYGDKRIGVAVAHTIARLPRPLLTLANDGTAIQQVRALVEQEHAGLVVVGLPRSMDGSVQAQAKLVESFASNLSEVLSVPLVFVDETLTSVQAEQRLVGASHKGSVKREDIDSMAAAIILERYFEENNSQVSLT